MNEKITYDTLIGLNNNMRVLFKLLHPMGLTIDELKQRADAHNYYKSIYYYVTEVQNNGNRAVQSVEC